jgi:hypothetical protein
LAQVPFVGAPLAVEQKSQEPLHALLQQTPSAQLPEVHWRDSVQAAPLFWGSTH